jgi:hypothetical protein
LNPSGRTSSNSCATRITLCNPHHKELLLHSRSSFADLSV